MEFDPCIVCWPKKLQNYYNRVNTMGLAQKNHEVSEKYPLPCPSETILPIFTLTPTIPHYLIAW